MAAPSGTVDSTGNQFWNATDACCNFDHSALDDVAYVTKLIKDISAEWNVDPKRVYLMGHSNGAFMSYRMGCEHPELLTGIICLAGETWADTSKCHPSEPVSILHLQGDADASIHYGGGAIGGVSYPGAVQTVATWAGYNHCSGTLVSAGENLDLDSKLPGAETSIQRESSCPMGIDLELWTIAGGAHLPAITGNFYPYAWACMKAYPKP